VGASRPGTQSQISIKTDLSQQLQRIKNGLSVALMVERLSAFWPPVSAAHRCNPTSQEYPFSRCPVAFCLNNAVSEAQLAWRANGYDDSLHGHVRCQLSCSADTSHRDHAASRGRKSSRPGSIVVSNDHWTPESSNNNFVICALAKSHISRIEDI
jgi:hypothetical protein